MPRATSPLRVWARGWKGVVHEAGGARTELGLEPDGSECNRTMWTLKEGRYELHITSLISEITPQQQLTQ